jgi:hypothetical protein
MKIVKLPLMGGSGKTTLAAFVERGLAAQKAAGDAIA